MGTMTGQRGSCKNCPKQLVISLIGWNKSPFKPTSLLGTVLLECKLQAAQDSTAAHTPVHVNASEGSMSESYIPKTIKINFPSYEGKGDPTTWMCKVEQFFRLYGNPCSRSSCISFISVGRQCTPMVLVAETGTGHCDMGSIQRWNKC